MALTATATPKIVHDIIGKLQMSDPLMVKTSFNRPNLHYTILPKPPATKMCSSIRDWIDKHHPGKPGIVYCLSRKSCEEFATKFRALGVGAEHYHAGLAQDEKEDVLRQWQSGDVQVIVATVRSLLTVLPSPHPSLTHVDSSLRLLSAWVSIRRTFGL